MNDEILKKAKEILYSEKFKQKIAEELNNTKDTINISEDLDFDTILVDEFVKFCKKFLKINTSVIVNLVSKKTPDFKTLAFYTIGEYTSNIYCKNRAMVDCLRSLAHELVHNKQDVENELQNPDADGSDGSPIENEANSKAGEIIRMFGKMHPEIYEF